MVIIEKKPEGRQIEIPRMIETPRLILRPWKKNKADAKALYALAKDPRVGPAAGWPVHRDAAYSMQVIRDVLSTPDIYAVLLKPEADPDAQGTILFPGTDSCKQGDRGPARDSDPTKDSNSSENSDPAEDEGPAKDGSSKTKEKPGRHGERSRDILIGAAGLTYGGTGRKWFGEDEAELGYWIGVPYWGCGYATEAAGALLQRAFEDLHMRCVWCGCYEGNERSRRVQEKCGFVYDHTDGHAYCEALREERVEHFSKMTRERFRPFTLLYTCAPALPEQ